MTRAQAQIAFAQGNAIRHNFFLDTEYIKLDEKNNMVDEDGIILSKSSFWLSRSGEQWNEGWSIADQQEPFTCDGCGMETKGQKHFGYDENFNVQKGVLFCDNCHAPE